jgi:hypothetical protein
MITTYAYAQYFGLEAVLLTLHKSKMLELSDPTEQGSWYRNETTDLYDPFEPTHLREALESPQNLGHLIFGKEEWIRIGGKLSDCLDPLTSVYCNARESTKGKVTGYFKPLTTTVKGEYRRFI